MKLNKGLFRDVSLEEQPSNTWIGGTNMVLSNKYTELLNEPGFTEISSNLGTIIGIIKMPNEFVIFTILDGAIQNSEIGIVRNGEYKIILRADFNFNTNYPVFGEYYYNYKNELIIYFSDKYNTPKVLNVDNIPFPVTSKGEIVNPADIVKTEMFSQFKNPTFKLKSVLESGGNLPSGSYYLTLQYELPDGSYSNFVQISNPITIYKDTSSMPFYTIGGCEDNTTTTKAISIIVNNIDFNFSAFRFGIIHKTLSSINCYVSESFYVESNSNNYIINTIDGLETIQLSDILVHSTYYTKIGSMVNIKDQLWIGDVEVSEELRYQKYANNIKLEYVYEHEVGLDKFKGSHKDPLILFDRKSFMPGEVMAFYIRFNYRGGNKVTNAFHIPGRPPVANDYAAADAEGLSIKSGSKKFHFEDTCSNTELSYWENENERYPNDQEYNGAYDYDNNPIIGGVDLTNGGDPVKVRHHRFPSVKYLHNQFGFVGEKASSYTEEINNNGAFIHSINGYTKELKFNYSYGNIGVMTAGNTIFTNTTSDSLTSYVNFNVSGGMVFLKANGVGWFDNVAGKALFKIYHNEIEIYSQEILTVDPHYPTNFSFQRSENITLNPSDTIRVSLTFVSIEYGNSNINAFISLNEGSFYNLVLTFSGANSNIDSNIVSKVLGIKVTNLYIPQYILDNCDSYEILYATRNNNNSIVLSQGMFTQKLSLDDTDVYDRFYDYDSISLDRSIAPSHISFEGYLAEQVYTGSSYSFTAYTDSKKYTKVLQSAYLDTDAKFGVVDNQYREKSIYVQTSNNYAKAFTGKVLAPGDPTTYGVYNGILATMYSLKSDVYLNYSNESLSRTGYVIPILNNIPGYVESPEIYGGDVTISLLGISRSLASATPPDVTDPNYWEYFRYVYNTIPIYSINNPGLRYKGKQLNERFYPNFNYLDNIEGLGDKYYGKHLLTGSGHYWDILKDTFSYIALYQVPEYRSLNNFTMINNIEPVIVFNHKFNYNTRFPFRVHKSIKQNIDSKYQNWRKFLPDEYYESTSNKGRIIELATDGEDLLILHEHTLLIAKVTSELKIDDVTTVSLGNSNIFDSAPMEIMYNKIGYVGCQSKFAVLNIPDGILIVDRRQGKIFIYKKYTIEEISAYGMESFFTNTLQYSDNLLNNYVYLFDDGDLVLFDDSQPVEYAIATLDQKRSIDNPYTQFGIHATWDDKYSRILITKRSTNVNTLGNDSFTISYYPEIKAWGFFHEYTPTMSLYNKNGFYLLHSNNIYKGNSANRNYYFNEYKGLYIDVVFNTPFHLYKLFNAITWITRYISDGLEYRTKTFDKIELFTKDQYSGSITLSTNTINDVNTLSKSQFFDKYKTSKANFYEFNIRNIGDTWNYNHVRDILLGKNVNLINKDNVNILNNSNLILSDNWEEHNLLSHPYMVVRLSLNPTTPVGEEYPIVNFKLLDITTTSTIIKR